MTEGTHLRIRQASQEGNETVHQVFIINNIMLGTAHKHRYELTESCTETSPRGSIQQQRVLG